MQMLGVQRCCAHIRLEIYNITIIFRQNFEGRVDTHQEGVQESHSFTFYIPPNNWLIFMFSTVLEPQDT